MPALRGYYPTNGRGPFTPAIADGGWERDMAGVAHRLATLVKSGTPLTTFSAAFGATSTSQSRALSVLIGPFTAQTIASWTFSTVIKCAETSNSGDAHLAVSIRRLNSAGVHQQLIAQQHATSTEFPLIASMATRIINALSCANTTFSDGDFIIIEVGIHGVTPANETMQLRTGDPVGVADFALTEGLTTDLVPWWEFSETPTFVQPQAVMSGSKREHFNGSLPSWITNVLAASGTQAISDSRRQLNGPANADVSMDCIRIDKTKAQAFGFRINPVTTTMRRFMWLLNRLATPVGMTFTAFEDQARMAVGMQSGTPNTLGIDRWTTAHVRESWNTGTSAWAAPSVAAVTSSAWDDYVYVKWEFDPTLGVRILIAHRNASSGNDQGLRWFAITDWTAWSSLEQTSNYLYLVYGKPYNDANPGQVDVEFIDYGDDTKIVGGENGKNIAGGTYACYAGHSYDEGLNWIPEDRTSVAVGSTPAAWDSADVKDLMLTMDGSTVVGYYDNLAHIGVGTFATDAESAFTKDAANPVISGTGLGTGARSLLGFPYCRPDTNEPDPDKKWKMLLVGFDDVALLWRVYYYTAPNRNGTFAIQNGGNPVLDVGSAGAFDEKGCNGPIYAYHNGYFYVPYAGTNIDPVTGKRNWRIGMAKGTALDALTKLGMILDFADASEAITANLTGRTVTRSSGAGFVKDMLAMFTQGTTQDNWGQSRVRVADTGSGTTELEHSMGGFTTASNARMVGGAAWGMHPRSLRWVASRARWEMHITLFQPARGETSSYDAFLETVALLVNTSTDPDQGTWSFDWENTPGWLLSNFLQARSCENIAIVQPSFATLVTKSVAGTMTPAGALTMKAKPTVTGTLSPTGTLLMTVKHPVSGSIAPAGALQHKTRIQLAGTVTPAASLAAAPITLQSVSGSIAPAGALVQRVQVQHTGIITLVGDLYRRARVQYGGTISPTGALQQLVRVQYGGTISPTGALQQLVRALHDGVLTPAGVLNTSTGAGKQIGGVLGLSGTLARVIRPAVLTGLLALSGDVTPRVTVQLLGVVVPSGALATALSAVQALGGLITPSGMLTRVHTPGPGGVIVLTWREVYGDITGGQPLLGGSVHGGGPVLIGDIRQE